MGVAFLCKEEGNTLDIKEGCGRMVGALLLMRTPEEKIEQYQLGHALLMKGVKAGGNFTKWQNDLICINFQFALKNRKKRLKQLVNNAERV